ncbi:MAG: preprotein translocase subunit SecE [Bacilli bacterium]
MKKIKSFFKGVKKETKTIRWPNGKSLVKYSTVTIILLVFFGLFFYGLDALFAFVRGLL